MYRLYRPSGVSTLAARSISSASRAHGIGPICIMKNGSFQLFTRNRVHQFRDRLRIVELTILIGLKRIAAIEKLSLGK